MINKCYLTSILLLIKQKQYVECSGMSRGYCRPGPNIYIYIYMGAPIGRKVVGSILHGGPIELFLVPASVPRLVQQRLLSCMWDDAYKRCC